LTVTLKNTTNHPIRIVGSDDRCDVLNGCTETKALPLEIPAGSSRNVEVGFHIRVSPYRYLLTFFTNDPDEPRVSWIISG